MKCKNCLEECFVGQHAIGVELPVSNETLHTCGDGKSYRLVGLRSPLWFVIQKVNDGSNT